MIRYSLYKNEKVRFSDQGRGRVVVLLHGFLESLEIWNEVARRLSKRYRVICIDLPGHGETPCMGYVHPMELMATCVKAVLKQLKVRKYVVIGHSMGGYVGLAFAQMYPEDIRGLGLFHSTALADSDEKKKGRERAIDAVKNDHKKFISDLVTNLFAEDNQELQKENIEKARSIASATSKRGTIAALEGMKERISREHVLRASRYPVLFIIGRKDKIIPPESMLPQLKLAKQNSVLMLNNSGHMGFYEEKEECLKALFRFIRKSFKGNAK